MTDEDNYALIPQLYEAQQAVMTAALQTAQVLEHPDAKGDTSELNWAKLLEDHLPRRYQVLAKVKAVDHTGKTSDEIGILVIDRQYSPFVFHTEARTYVPAESVYAAFECKQDLTRHHVLYAAGKVQSVRVLDRTSAAIVHAGGSFPPPASDPHHRWSIDHDYRVGRDNQFVVHRRAQRPTFGRTGRPRLLTCRWGLVGHLFNSGRARSDPEFTRPGADVLHPDGAC